MIYIKIRIKAKSSGVVPQGSVTRYPEGNWSRQATGRNHLLERNAGIRKGRKVVTKRHSRDLDL